MKEETIRPAGLLDRYLELCRADAEALVAASDLLRAPCPACGADDGETAFTKWGFNYEACRACATLYMNPRPTESALQRFYDRGEAGRFWASDFYPRTIEGRREPVYRRRAEWLQRFFLERGSSPASILDVGCGVGVFPQELRRAFPKTRVIGLEPGADLAKAAAAGGTEVVQEWLESERLPDLLGKVDCITLFEVMEHFHDPARAMRHVAALLPPGGVLYFTTLCSDGFDVQMLWGDHKNIYPPCHINILSRDGFRRLLERTGFRVLTEQSPGKLDVDIVRKAGARKTDARGFFSRLVYGPDEELAGRFQEFLAANRLSSHYWVAAERTGD